MPTAQEVAQHNTAQDAWLVIRGVVYDVSAYAKSHPGGAGLLLKLAGKDATKSFETNHAPSILDALPESAAIGPLVGSNASLLPQATSARDRRQAELQAQDQERAREARRKQPRLRSILNLLDFERVFRTGIITPVPTEFFDGGAESEATLLANRAAFSRYWFNPRVLRRVGKIDLSSPCLGGGATASMPIIVSGVGNTFQSGDNEVDIGLTRALGKCRIPHMVSTFATTPVAQLATQHRVSPEQVHYFQLYVNKDHKSAAALVRKTVQAGARAVFVTVDVPTAGNRERDRRVNARADGPVEWPEDEKRWVDKDGESVDADGLEPPPGRGSHALAISAQDQDLNWDDLSWIGEAAGDAVVAIKGVQSVEDAVLAAQKGVKAIVLSNHGGRQLDYSRAPMDVLWDLRQKHPEVFDQVDVLIDGGFWRGTDVLKALCLGAKAVAFGRAFYYAYFTYGELGVIKAARIIEEELVAGMRMLGAASLADLKPEMVVRDDFYGSLIAQKQAAAKL